MAKAAVVEGTTQENALERAAAGPEKLATFLKDTRLEMHKVVTPTRDEVRTNTIIVIATVFLFAAYFLLIDQTIGRGIDKLLLKLTGH